MNQPPSQSSARQRFQLRPEYLLVMAFVLIAALILIWFFERLPIEGTMLGVDWQSLYPGLQGGHVTYKGGSVMIAPWTLPAVLPLGFFSMRAGWGLLALLDIFVLIASVPRRGRRLDILSIFLLMSSFLTIRQVVDGNLEVLVIAGAVLTVYGYRQQKLLPLAIGLLLATAKPQETWLMMIVLAIYLIRTRTPRQLAALGGALAIVVIPALLLFGRSWVLAMTGIEPPPGTILDITLLAALNRLGVSRVVALSVWLSILIVTVYVTLRDQPTLSREKAGMLIAASLLLAPYAAGDSVLTVLAIGIIPTFQKWPRLGWLLIILVDLQYLLNWLARDFLYWNGAYYWTGFLILVWAIWAWQIYSARPRMKKELSVAPSIV